MNYLDIIDVCCVYQTLDEYGRLGALVAVCRNIADANIAAKGQGWYGGSGRILEKKAIQDGDNLYPLISETPWTFKDVEELRAKEKQKVIDETLAKLTHEEQELIKSVWLAKQ